MDIPCRFRVIDAFSSKKHVFPTPTSGGTLCDINEIYTILKSTLNRLFRRWQYGLESIRLAVVGFQVYEIVRNSEKIRAYSRSRSSKVIDLGVNRKRMRIPINCH